MIFTTILFICVYLSQSLETCRYQQRSLDTTNIASNSQKFTTTSSMFCLVMAQRFYKWTISGVVCFKSPECYAKDVSVTTVEAEGQNQQGFTCYAVEPTKSDILSIALSLNINVHRKTDGLYYFYGTTALDYDKSRAYCHQIPGFDHPRYITKKQLDVGFDLNVERGPYFIGLENTGSNTGWMNGIKYSVTQANTGHVITYADPAIVPAPYKYHIYGMKLYNLPSWYNQSVVCQGNLDKIDWLY